MANDESMTTDSDESTDLPLKQLTVKKKSKPPGPKCDARLAGNVLCGQPAVWFDNRRDLGMCQFHMILLAGGRHQTRTGFRKLKPR